MGQRLVKQVFAFDRACRDVLEVGLEIKHFGDRHQQQAAALLAGEMGAPAAAHGLADTVEQLRLERRLSGRLVQRGEQALGADRFQQVIDGVEIEGLHCVVVVGRGEHDGRRPGQGAEVAGQLDAVHARHADVGEHDVDRLLAQEIEGGEAVHRFADDCARQLAGQIAEQFAQAGARQRLVVDDEDFQRIF